METYNRGKEPKTLASLMKDKLYWIFQADPVGRIVHRDKQETATKMSFRCSTVTNEELVCSVNAAGRVTASAPGTGGRFARAHENKLPNSIFIPQKEVLTLYHIIIPAREDDQSFGFDETYYDLAKVIQRPPTKGKNFAKAAEARQKIHDIFAADASYDDEAQKWVINKDGMVFDIEEASEGVKKISILDILLGNRYIRPGSAVFIDEPEAGLHPSAISSYMEAIMLLCHMGLQIFIATHSYFCIRKLENLARQNNISIPTFSYQKHGDDMTWIHGDLREGFPDNPIVQESIKLYREDIDNLIG